MSKAESLEHVRARALAERGCSSDPCGSKVCQAQRDRIQLLEVVDELAKIMDSTYRDAYADGQNDAFRAMAGPA